jgi:hypothetical protein
MHGTASWTEGQGGHDEGSFGYETGDGDRSG